jgi:hypothetical protein
MLEKNPCHFFADDGDLLYIRGKYKIYNMDENELKEALKELEEQGWNPMICDTLMTTVAVSLEADDQCTIATSFSPLARDPFGVHNS